MPPLDITWPGVDVSTAVSCGCRIISTMLSEVMKGVTCKMTPTFW